MSRFPVAFRPPAFASRSSDSRRGIPPSSRSAYRTKPSVRTSTGLPRSARTSCDRGGCSLYPEDDGAHPSWSRSPTSVCRFAAASPCTPPYFPSTGISLNEASTRVQAIRPSGLPLTHGRPDGTGHRFGFPPSFAPRRPGAGRRTSGQGQAIEHGPGTTLTSHQTNLQTCSLVSCDIASHPATQGRRGKPASARLRVCRRRGARDAQMARSTFGTGGPPDTCIVVIAVISRSVGGTAALGALACQ